MDRTFSLRNVMNSRLLTVLLLGFSSGLPLALTGSTLQAWLTTVNLNLVTIGAVSLIGVPYVWKFMWAPLLDRFIPPIGGRRRGWIMLLQLFLCITLFVIARIDPRTHAALLCAIAVVIAFLSATQDIAIDAYRTDVLQEEERGLGSAYFIFGYRMAMLISGGLALIIADYWGWAIAYQLMAVLIGLAIFVTLLAPSPVSDSLPSQSLWSGTKEAFQDLWSRPSIVVIMLFIIFYKLGDAFALSLVTNFLLHGLGFSLKQVGFAFKTVSLLGTIGGAIVGGAVLIRLNLYRGLFLFGVLQALSTFLFLALTLMGKNYLMLIATLFVENFCTGMGTAAFLAFLMSLCRHQHSATQFACLSALSAVGRVLVGPFAGIFVVKFGWTTFFGFSIFLALPGLVLLYLLRNKVVRNEAYV